MARKPDGPVKRAIKAAIAKHVVESQGHPKTDSNVSAAAEEIGKTVAESPGWHGMPNSPRTIYTLLAEGRRLRRLTRLLPFRKRHPK